MDKGGIFREKNKRKTMEGVVEEVRVRESSELGDFYGGENYGLNYVFRDFYRVEGEEE